MMPEEQSSELSSTLHTPVCECTYANMFMRTCIYTDTLMCTCTQTHARTHANKALCTYVHIPRASIHFLTKEKFCFCFVSLERRGGSCTKALGIVDESSITELHPIPVKSFNRETAALAKALFGNSVSVLRIFSLLILLG